MSGHDGAPFVRQNEDRCSGGPWGQPNDWQPRTASERKAMQGPRFIWWGWRGVWKRPAWFTRGILGSPEVRELGIGPISYVWHADDGFLAWRGRV